jgi:uncharacterized cupredoxin-like copper-binding protein
MTIKLGVIAATALLFVAPHAWAATSAPAKKMIPQIIHVSLTGEEGLPMGVKLDQPMLKAGLITFDVKNDAFGTDHEAVLVKLSSKDQVIPSDPKVHKVNEKKLKTLGEVGSLQSGKSGTLKVKLKAGEYALICNHKSHYELGMATRFTVTN